MEKKYGFKVLRRKNSRAFMPATDAALQRIVYRVGQTTERDEDEHGAFAVFENYEDAAQFLRGYGDVIAACEYVESDDYLWKKNPPVFVRNAKWLRQRGENYHAESGGVKEKTGGFPRGTVFADSVTITKILFEE